MSKPHIFFALAGLAVVALIALAASPAKPVPSSLWQVYEQSLKGAKYVDLTHTVNPAIPVWAGFGHSTFGPAIDPKTGKPFTYSKDGFEATHYDFATDQLGTQLDPPAHWDPNYPAIDELPATYAVRPLVVISIAGQVKKDPGYHLTVADVQAWEHRHGRIPEGSVVFVRSDWSKEWPNPELATRTKFPGVKLDALQFLHLQRHILFHGHEPLDTDTTPTLEGESWLMHHGYTQAEGVANLDQVPETGGPGRHRLSQAPGRHRRLRALHCHLPAGLEVRGHHRRRSRGAAPPYGEAAPLGHPERHPGAVNQGDRGCS